MNPYIVNCKLSDYGAMREARDILFPGGGQPPASTLVGVTSLAVDGLLVEIEESPHSSQSTLTMTV